MGSTDCITESLCIMLLIDHSVSYARMFVMLISKENRLKRIIIRVEAYSLNYPLHLNSESNLFIVFVHSVYLSIIIAFWFAVN